MPHALALIDRCYLGTQGTPNYGEPNAAYSYDTNTAVRCLVMNEVPRESGNGLQLPMGAVKIAFRSDSGVTAGTRVQVYRRLRQTLAASEYYTVDGPPRMVRRRLIAMCQRSGERDGR